MLQMGVYSEFIVGKRFFYESRRRVNNHCTLFMLKGSSLTSTIFLLALAFKIYAKILKYLLASLLYYPNVY